MRKVSFKAVIVGSITDIVATNILVIPLLIYVMHALMQGDTEASPSQLASDAAALLQSNPLYFTIATILGSIASIIGGYVAAAIADRHEILNGALASFLCIIAGVYNLYWPHDSAPLMQHVAFLIAAPILTGFGGFLRTRF